jgi:hypothetical protein
MNISVRIFFVFILAVMTSSCGKDDMPKYQSLGDLRILTVLVDKPEANPGDPVTFTPVLSDLHGNGRTINFSVQACIDPGLSYGADPVCTNPDPQSIRNGSHIISAGTDSTYTDLVSSFTLTMPDQITMFAGRNEIDKENGVIYLVQYNIRIENGPAINSFLRVFVSNTAKTPKNQNPLIASVDLNDNPLSSATSSIPMPGVSNFRVVSPPSSSETYTVIQPDGSVLIHTEEMLNTWFVTDGEFDYSRTTGSAENKWSPPGAKPSGRNPVIVVVTRDGRGGSTFKKIEMY